eukprot:5627318-Prymnesium_polylepis.1
MYPDGVQHFWSLLARTTGALEARFLEFWDGGVFFIVSSVGDLTACVVSVGCRARSAICCALVCTRAAVSDFASSAARFCRST